MRDLPYPEHQPVERFFLSDAKAMHAAAMETYGWCQIDKQLATAGPAEDDAKIVATVAASSRLAGYSDGFKAQIGAMVVDTLKARNGGEAINCVKLT